VRVLLVRLDGVGDAAVCVPLLAALRDAGHEVGVALTTRNAGLFAPHAIVAEHVLERILWPAHGSTPASTARANAEIAVLRYDVALIASEEPEAYELAARIPQRIGFATGWTRPLKSLWVRTRTTRTVSRSQRVGGEDAHEVEVMYRLGAGLVRDPAPPAGVQALRAVLLEQPHGTSFTAGQPNRPVVVQTGTKWTSIGVPPAAQRALFEGLRPYARFFAAPGEARAVAEATGVEPETFATTRAWVEALGRAQTVVSVDTGAAHVGGMVAERVFDVFPDAQFEAQVRRWRPWASRYRAFRASEVAGRSSALIEAVLDGF